MQPKTPNVYIQEKSIFPPSVAEVSTAIPAFIGRTDVKEDGAGESLVNQPIRVTSMLEYERWFGGPFKETFENFDAVVDADTGAIIGVELTRDAARKPAAMAQFILYHCIAHYFANGGGACYVVTTGDYASFGATTAGEEADEFKAALMAVEKVDEVTLLVVSDAAARMGAENRVHYYGIGTAAIDQCVKMKDRFALVDTIDSMIDLNMADDLASVRANTPAAVERTKYGATYYPYLRTTMAREYDESKVTIRIDADNSVTMDDPSLAGTAVYAQLKSQLGAQYMALPPCPAMAGIYSRVDGSRGVWKAPANVAVTGVVGPTRIIDNATQEAMNVDTVAGKSINAIRAFTGKGTLVWGARTLAGNDNEWRYVPVRRLFNMVEESVQKASAFAVFEPNTPFTWLKLKTMIESYLEGLWKQGALFGDSKEVAYFVNVGLGQTMTEADINNGIMNIEIGLAAVRPAEFIMLTFSHKSISG